MFIQHNINYSTQGSLFGYTPCHYPYLWYKSDYKPLTCLKAFGLFVCGGGSTMGCKLAGFDHLGGVELMKSMAEVYKLNHNPKYLYIEDIRHFNTRTDLPEELYQLDLLELSPPCTSFSTQGKREKGWGVARQYDEGNTLQTLDDLVAVSAHTTLKLKPKTFIMENVMGLLQGNAIKYFNEFVDLLKNDYNMQAIALNGARVGLPQSRCRAFVIGSRKDLNLQPLEFNWNHEDIPFSEIRNDSNPAQTLTPQMKAIWDEVRHTPNASVGKFASRRILDENKPVPTLTSTPLNILSTYPRVLDHTELKKAQSFPMDYDFDNLRGENVYYITGMSVPPIMIAHIAHEIREQWFNIHRD